MKSIEANLEKLQQDDQSIPLKGDAKIKELMRQKEALLSLHQEQQSGMTTDTEHGVPSEC